MVLNVKFACNLTLKLGITKHIFKKPYYLKLILKDLLMTFSLNECFDG